MLRSLLLGVLILLNQNAFAHGSSGSALEDVYPWYGIIALNLTLLSYFYTKGWRQKRRETKGLLFFYAGIVSIVIALFPPIDLISDKLLSIHMIQHMLLMMAAAPLFVFGYSDYFIRLGLFPQWKRKLWSITRASTRFGLTKFTKPLMVGILYTLILWLWHIPILFESALGNRAIHNIQHLLFFAVSYFFWKVLLRKIGSASLNPASGILYLFVASVHSATLGVLMAFSPSVWYRSYENVTYSYGLTALEDQQIAGYIMWMPAGTSYFIVMIWLALKLTKDSGDSSKLFGGDHG